MNKAFISVFSFRALEPKRKRGIGGISGKGQFRMKKRLQTDFLYNEIDHEVIYC